jgi:hypothetical protein
MLGIILIFILALALLGTSPVWSYSRHRANSAHCYGSFASRPYLESGCS